MKIHQGLDNFPKIKNAIVTSGTFDGVHLGHIKILNRLREITEASNGESVLITFWPHPRLVLQPDFELKLLTDFDEKMLLLEKYGIDHLVKIPFTKTFSTLSSEAFVKDILIEKINTSKLVIGYNHHFGRNREGSFEYLKQNAADYGFEIEEIARQDVALVGVSSTKIRKALEKGEVDIAQKLLGRNYSVEGTVIHGNKNGKKIGFATANIHVNDTHKLIPADGVYAVKISYGRKEFPGMLNIGNRPTIKDNSKTIEVHIIDFSEDIYDEKLEIAFVKRVRDEVKFESLEALKQQLRKDKGEVLEILKSR